MTSVSQILNSSMAYGTLEYIEVRVSGIWMTVAFDIAFTNFASSQSEGLDILHTTLPSRRSAAAGLPTTVEMPLVFQTSA